MLHCRLPVAWTWTRGWRWDSEVGLAHWLSWVLWAGVKVKAVQLEDVLAKPPSKALRCGHEE